MAFGDQSRRHSRIDRAVKENGGSGDVAYVAYCCCFVNVDREGCVEVVVVVSAVHVDCVAWGKGFRDCSVCDRAVGYSYRVGVGEVGCCA